MDSYPGVTVASPDATRRWNVVASREHAFLALYGAEYAPLASYCWRLTRNAEVAADLAQESFTRLYARWLGVREPRAYLYHVATNLVRRQWRQQAQTAAAPLHEPAVASSPDDGLAVRLAVERLPRRLRDVVLLHYYADLSVADVAEAVQRPAGTVKRQLSEARRLLAERLEHDDV
jgi:RNA polymerase sigma-70 factor (ECF subfamily)